MLCYIIELIIGASLSESYINVLNVSGVSMYVYSLNNDCCVVKI